jgi:acyl carrier protein
MPIRSMQANFNPPWINSLISLRAHNGDYVAAEHEGKRLTADRQEVNSWEIFVAVPHPLAGGVALLSQFGYVSARCGGGGSVEANRNKASEWEYFIPVSTPDGKWAFKTYSGHYLSADKDKGMHIVADRGTILSWECFSVNLVRETSCAPVASASSQSNETTQENRDRVAARVKKVIAETCGVDIAKIGLDNSIFLGENSKFEPIQDATWLPNNDFGMDKLDAVELLIFMNDEFDLNISDDEVEGIRTVRWVVDFILSKENQ